MGKYDDTCYKRPPSELDRLIDIFVNESFNQSHLDQTDILTKRNCFILFADLMHKHNEFEQWDCELFDKLFSKYEQK